MGTSTCILLPSSVLWSLEASIHAFHEYFHFVQELWLQYLDLYSSQSNRDELREICNQAVEFSPTYSVWWKYLEYSQTYHDKRAVCLRLISFLTANPSDPIEVHSHCILETLLYLIQLELYSGHYKSALAVFKAALTKKPSSSPEVPELSSHLLPSDFCFAWLAYIHIFEFHRLPAPWFDPRHGKPSRMVTKEDFVFPWKPSQQSRASGEKLLAMFQGKEIALYFLTFFGSVWMINSHRPPGPPCYRQIQLTCLHPCCHQFSADDDLFGRLQ